MVSYNLELVDSKYMWVVRINSLIAGIFTAREEAQEYIRILSQFGMYEGKAA